MVLFHNINVGQRVEVNVGWGTIRGTVQYKGCLVGKQGDWVGVHLESRGNKLMKYFYRTEMPNNLIKSSLITSLT